MKKFLSLSFGFILVCLLFISCSFSLSEKLRGCLSEESKTLYSGEGSNFFVTLTCGLREEPYIIDGKSQTKVNFSVVTVTFFTTKADKEIPCTVIIGANQYEAVLEKNMINSNYMTDLELELSTENIQLILGEERISLVCKSSDFETSSAEAIKIAGENLGEELSSKARKSGFNYECYLKIINNPVQYKNIYFWHFSIKNADETLITIIIDTMSQTVLAKY